MSLSICRSSLFRTVLLARSFFSNLAFSPGALLLFFFLVFLGSSVIATRPEAGIISSVSSISNGSSIGTTVTRLGANFLFRFLGFVSVTSRSTSSRLRFDVLTVTFPGKDFPRFILT